MRSQQPLWHATVEQRENNEWQNKLVVIRNAVDLSDPLQYWFAMDRSQAQQQLHRNLPRVSMFMQCYMEMGQQPMFDGVAQPKPSRRAPTPRGNGKYLCQLQLETQPACNRVSNRGQKWTPREKYRENGHTYS